MNAKKQNSILFRVYSSWPYNVKSCFVESSLSTSIFWLHFKMKSDEEEYFRELFNQIYHMRTSLMQVVEILGFLVAEQKCFVAINLIDASLNIYFKSS